MVSTLEVAKACLEGGDSWEALRACRNAGLTDAVTAIEQGRLADALAYINLALEGVNA